MTLRRGYEYRTYGGYAGEVLKEIGDGLDVSAPWGTSTAASFGRAIIMRLLIGVRPATCTGRPAGRRARPANGAAGRTCGRRGAAGGGAAGVDHAMEQAAAQILGVGFGQRGSMGFDCLRTTTTPGSMWAASQQFRKRPGLGPATVRHGRAPAVPLGRRARDQACV